MSARPSQRLPRSAPWALRLASLPIPLILLAALLRHLGMIELPPFFVSLALAWGLAAGALVVAALAFRSIWVDGAAGLKETLIAVTMALVVLALPAAVLFDLFRLPRLADISTDGEDPPLFTVAPEVVTMRPLPSPAARAEQVTAYPDVVPRHYPLSPERVFQSVEAIVAQKGWHVTDSRAPDTDNEVGWVEAEGSTLVFALPVDIVIRVIGDDDGTLIDMRSASRVGAHDLGDNAARIRDFLGSLDTMLQGVTDQDMPGDDSDSDAAAPDDLPPLPVPSPVSGR